VTSETTTTRTRQDPPVPQSSDDDITEADAAEEMSTVNLEKPSAETHEVTESDADDSEAGDEDTAIDGEESADVTDAAPTGRKWARAGIAVLAVLLLAALSVTALLYLKSYRPAQQTNAARTQIVLDAAKTGTVAALSYSPDNLDKDLATAKSHLTGDFLNYYTQFTDEVVRPAVKHKQVATAANVVRAAVSEMHPDTATVLVFVNQETTSKDRNEPSMVASSVLVTMTKTDGNWLISAFNPI
jgi:Mce-associated membrane protein